MNILKTLRSKVTGLAFPALNWYKIGAIVIVIAAYTFIIDQRATHRCELKHEQQRTEQAQKKLEQVADHVEKRLPVVAKKEKASAELRGDVQRTKNKNEGYIYENENRNSGSCDLSDAEFSGVQELIRQSREAAK